MKQSKVPLKFAIWEIFSFSIIMGFFVFSLFVGGTAGLGYSDGANYFVRNHGDVVQVSELIWKISCIFEVIFWLNFPSMIICYLLKNRALLRSK